MARTAMPCSMTCCPPGLHEAWPRGDGRGKIEVRPASVSASRAGVATARESRTPAVWGGQRWGQHSGEAWPPSPLAGLTARRRASSQRRAVARRAIWLSAWTFGPTRPRRLKAEGGALCRQKGAGKITERAGATPPPAPLRGPGSDPGGGRSCPICYFGEGSA